MPQQFWQIENPEGPPYEVGLYHGQDSGHLIVYVGSRVIAISFSVVQAKRYTFYLGHTLYELVADPAAGQWNYTVRDMSANRVISPQNVVSQSKILWSDMIKVLFMFLLLAGFLIFYVFYKP